MEVKNLWEDFYKNNAYTMWWPSECIIRFIKGEKKRRNINKVLDFGCGNGRHVFFLAKEGLIPYGVDISEVSVGMAKEWMAKEKLEANLSVYDGKKLPYEDNYFDSLISYGVLDHIQMKDAISLMDEIHRVVKPGGTVCLTLRSTRDFECGVGEKIDKNTYIIPGDVEGELPQHFFDCSEVEELFKNFSDIKIECEDRAFGKGLSYIYSRWTVIGMK